MRILHIATNIEGGAGVVAYLHQNLLNEGIQSSILHLYPTGRKNSNLFLFPPSKRAFFQKLSSRLGFPLRKDDQNRRKLLGKKESNYLFTFPTSDHDIHEHPLVKQADIVHLHWVATFVDWKSLALIDKPMVWTLHDMNPFTGGCHHSAGCLKYTTDCQKCFQLEGTSDLDNACKNLSYKQKFTRGKKIHIVALNKWMRSCSQASKLFHHFEHSIIPNSIDLNIFRPLPKSVSRARFNLSLESIVIGFCSSYQAKGKGSDLLQQAFNELLNEYPQLVLCSVGSEFKDLNNTKNYLFAGKAEDPQFMASFYSAIDALVIPSREDNLPTVMLEALACGTPVIGFKVGGIPDFVKNNETGLIAEEISVNGLKEAIKNYITNRSKFDSDKIRKFAEENFSNQKQVSSYKAIYEKIINL